MAPRPSVSQHGEGVRKGEQRGSDRTTPSQTRSLRRFVSLHVFFITKNKNQRERKNGKIMI